MEKSIKRIFTIFTLFSLFSFTALSNDAPKSNDIFLARISTSYVKKSYDLLIRINEQKLISAILTKNNKKNKIKIYSVHVLHEPIHLVKAVGINLVSLTCTNFATSRGCDIIIEYPYNLTIGKFKKFHAKLLKVDRQWQLQDQNGKRFQRLELQAKTILGILIGIKRIIPHAK